MSENKGTFSDLTNKATIWWNGMNGYDKNYYVKRYEGGVVLVAALTEGAVIRLYLKVFENLTKQQAFERYHDLLNKNINKNERK
jgi:hypothetical protein